MRVRPEALLGALACLLAAAASPSGAAGGPGRLSELRPGVAATELRSGVTRADLESHVRFLASDELEGRATGTPGGEAAARYLADALARAGVEPAGDEGKFFQRVPLHRASMSAVPELALSTRARGDGRDGEGRIRAVYGRDFEVAWTPADVADLRIAVARSAAEIPAQADASQAIFVDAPLGKPESWLEDAGHPEGEGFGLWIRPGSASPGEEKGVGGRAREPRSPRRSRPWITLRGPLLERLRQGEIETLSLRTNVREEEVAAFNVVGRVAGAGLPDRPELAHEALVVSAHYDHLPPRAQPAGRDGIPDAPGAAAVDRIFNGADDDASGCAAVLEIAEELASGKRPARTVVFLLATGEEIGLLGTKAYLERPAVPLDRTVANLNVEMIGRPDPLAGGPGRLWLTGFERTDLGRACAEAGLPVSPDLRPDQHFFERSDNYAFVLRGVVGQTFSSYNLHGDYHTVEDEAERVDYGHMEECTRALVGAVRLVADGKLRPSWLEGQTPARR